MEVAKETNYQKSVSSSIKYLKPFLLLFILFLLVVLWFLSQGAAVNKEYYLDILYHFCEAIHRKQTDLRKNIMELHHNNASANTLCIV